jgi:Xaa-Pro aminopeptidase
VIGERLARLRARLAAEEGQPDGLMVVQAENRRYLSGFTGSAGTLFVTAGEAVLVTDFRYLEQAADQAPGFRIVRAENSDPMPASREVIGELQIRRLGFEAAHLSYAQYVALAEVLAADDVALLATEGVVETIRMVKDAAELAKIAHAVALADDAIDYAAREVLRPGVTEREIAWAIEKRMRGRGADGLAFDTIVAGGPNAAMPHHRASEREIDPGEPVVIDMGALADGYRSDVTRTVWYGTPSPRLREIYDIVLGAQNEAEARVRAGMSGKAVDALARDFITAAGYGEQFGHSLGHGIGLAVHELPWVGKTVEDALPDGAVFSIEPGVYLPGWGGVRIEDLVVLEGGAPRILTRARKPGPLGG